MQLGQMELGAIAFVAAEPVGWKETIVECHERIAGHFRHDRGAGDRIAALVAADHRMAWQWHLRGLVSIDHDQRRNSRKGGDGLLHRQERGPADVVGIDSFHADNANTHVGLGENCLVGALPLQSGQPLGIVDAHAAKTAPQHDRRGDHRPGPRATAGLIDAGHESIAWTEPEPIRMTKAAQILHRCWPLESQRCAR